MPDASTVDHAVRQCQPETRHPFGVMEWPACWTAAAAAGAINTR